MLGNVRKVARSSGRFLTDFGGWSLNRINDFERKANKINQTYATIPEMIVENTGIKPAYDAIMNPLKTVFHGVQYAGEGLKLLGSESNRSLTDNNNIRQGILNLNQAYELGKSVL